MPSIIAFLYLRSGVRFLGCTGWRQDLFHSTTAWLHISKKMPKNKNQGPKKRETNENIREVLHEQSCAVELSCDEVQRKKCILFGTQQLGLDPWFEESRKIRSFGNSSRHFLAKDVAMESLKVFGYHDGFQMDPIVDNRTGEVEIPTIFLFVTRISDIHARSFFVVLFELVEQTE